MFNFLDVMKQAQGNADAMARQFGVTPEQVQRATAALLPAFAMGLQRNVSNPGAMDQLIAMTGAGHYAAFLESASRTFSPQAWQEGNALVSQLFGSPDVSRQVANQTAAFSGITPEVVMQMMPLMAGMFMGALLKATLSQSQESHPGQATPGAPHGFPSVMNAASWEAFFRGVLGGMATLQQTPASPQATSSTQPRKRSSAAPSRPAPRPEPDEEIPAEEPAPLDAWSKMVDVGREVQQQHLNALQGIFDSFWGQTGRR